VSETPEIERAEDPLAPAGTSGEHELHAEGGVPAEARVAIAPDEAGTVDEAAVVDAAATPGDESEAPPAAELAGTAVPEPHPVGDIRPAVSDVASPEVGRALDELAALGELELEDHPDAYQRIHVELQGALSSIDDA
jgi:hypothetical protein